MRGSTHVHINLLEREIADLRAFHGCILQNEHDLKQRRVAHVAARLQGIHQIFERQVLMIVGGQRGCFFAFNHFAKSGIVVELIAQNERVNEQADQRLDFRSITIGNGSTDG